MKKVMLKTQQSGLKCRIIKKRGKYLIQYYGQGEILSVLIHGEMINGLNGERLQDVIG